MKPRDETFTSRTIIVALAMLYQPSANAAQDSAPAYCGAGGPRCLSGRLGGEDSQLFGRMAQPFKNADPALTARLAKAVAPGTLVMTWSFWAGPPATQVAIAIVEAARGSTGGGEIRAFQVLEGLALKPLRLSAELDSLEEVFVAPTNLLDDGGRQLAIVTSACGNAGCDVHVVAYQLVDREFIQVFSSPRIQEDMAGGWKPDLTLGEKAITVGTGRRAKRFVWDGHHFSESKGKTGR